VIDAGAISYAAMAATLATTTNPIYVSAGAGGGITFTIDTSANLITALPGVAIGDSIDFTLINTAAQVDTVTAQGTSSVVGVATVNAAAASFRIVFTDVTGGAGQFVCYRL
jgi:hypothetical protein